MQVNKKAIGYTLAGIIFLSFAFIFYSPFKKNDIAFIHNEGKAQGTYYSATYQQPQGKNLQLQIDSLFANFDLSLSTYVDSSIISRINKNDNTVRTDTNFETMFACAQLVSQQTHGAFDITVAPLVNAWGFGFTTGDTTHLPDLRTILPHVGYQKVQLINHQVIKKDPKVMLDASALAQGLSADLVAKLFEKNGCLNYMIDIGGEIVCKGNNPKGTPWQIGIDKPVDDPENADSELQTVLNISNAAFTTSGNYRKFYYKNGKKYAHTINPKTGMPVLHNLLSATVVAPNCMIADAYATSCMVLGRDEALAFCKKLTNVDCYLIYTDEAGKYQTIYTTGFKKYLKE